MTLINLFDIPSGYLCRQAVTRLFEKGLNPIEVGMVSGHKTLSMLQRYTHLRSKELVHKLG